MAVKKNRNDIIESALRKAGILAVGEEPSAEQTQAAAEDLDDMVKSWQATGAHLWSELEATLFVQPGQIKYQLGGDTTDHATEEYTETTLSVASVTNDNTVTLTNDSDLLVDDTIGITLDTGDIFWTTVTEICPPLLADLMPSDAAAGNSVYFYTTDITKPLRVPDARRRQSSQDIEMIKLGRIDYLNLPNKNSSGTPTQFYYKPNISSGQLFLWPSPTSSTTTIKFTYFRPLRVFSDADDEMDLPNEWVEAIKYNLAVRQAVEYGLNPNRLSVELAGVLYNNAYEWDQDDGDMELEFAYGRGQ
jgi:hypothetical protein